MFRVILGLAAAGVLWFVASDGGAQPQPPKAGKANAPVGWLTEVKGYGETIEDARKNALKSAVERVKGFLRAQDPPLEAWQPDEEYVRTHLLEGAGQPGADVKLEVGLVKVWVQPLRDAPNWTEMVQLNQAAQRRVLSAERQTTAGFALAALTALLATAWGYFRLDEWTGGRFSKWLLIGAIALLSMTGTGWLLTAW
jgi:hypothetical protein